MKVLVELSRREHRRLLRQRGRLRTRKAANSPCTSRYLYWSAWWDIRAEWEYLNYAGWQARSCRRAYRGRLQDMRAIRLRLLPK